MRNDARMKQKVMRIFVLISNKLQKKYFNKMSVKQEPTESTWHKEAIPPIEKLLVREDIFVKPEPEEISPIDFEQDVILLIQLFSALLTMKTFLVFRDCTSES